MSEWLEQRLAEGRRLLEEKRTVPFTAAAYDESGASAGAGAGAETNWAKTVIEASRAATYDTKPQYPELFDGPMTQTVRAPFGDTSNPAMADWSDARNPVRLLSSREIQRLTVENETLRRERDALADAVKALSPTPVAKPSDNHFARRHSGRAPDSGEPR